MFGSSKKSGRKSSPASHGEPPGGASERVGILLEALADLASTLDLDEVLDRILARSLEVAEAERALVLLGSGEEGLKARRALRAGGKSMPPEEMAFSSSSVRLALREGRPITQELGSDTEALAAGHSLFELKLRSVMCAPMRIGEKTLGAIYVDSRVQRKNFSRSDLDLFEALARQAGIALQNARLLAASREQARLARELEIGAEIQADLLPRRAPSLPGVEFAAAMVACEELSGDFYDFIPLGEERMAFFVADVSGHGVGPALLAAEARGEIRALLSIHSDPGEILSRVHANLRETIDPGRFLTLILVLVDGKAGRISYASAGHPEALLLRGGEALWLGQSGPPLGVDVDVRYATRTLDGIAAGDSLCAFTDGILEARGSGSKELYGQERLLASAGRAQGGAPARLQGILDDLASFDGGLRNDDRTVLMAVWR